MKTRNKQSKQTDAEQSTSRGGRKKKDPEQVRSYKITIRLKKEERDQLVEHFANSRYRTMGEFCYRMIIGARVTVTTQIALSPEIALELKRIGNNINQIAFHLNVWKGREIGDPTYAEIKKVALYLHELLQKGGLK